MTQNLKSKNAHSKFEQQLLEMVNVRRQVEVGEAAKKCQELKATILMERTILNTLYGFGRKALNRDDNSDEIRFDLKEPELSVIKERLEKAIEKLRRISEALAKKTSFEQESRLRLLKAYGRLGTSLGLNLSSQVDEVYSELMDVDYKYQPDRLDAKSIIDRCEILGKKCESVADKSEKLKRRLTKKIPGFDEKLISQIISEDGVSLSDLDLDILLKFKKSRLRKVLRIKLA